MCRTDTSSGAGSASTSCLCYDGSIMERDRLTYTDRIATDPRILVGKPTVKGTRIAVELVLAHLAENPDLGDLFAAYPRLTREDVQACLAYAGHAVSNQGRHLARRQLARSHRTG